MYLLVPPKNIESISQFQPNLTEGFFPSFLNLSGWVERQSLINPFLGGEKGSSIRSIILLHNEESVLKEGAL